MPEPVRRDLKLVAARGRDGAIGRGNALPWRLPDDLAHFKRLTLGGALVMGRKTAESLGRALSRRASSTSPSKATTRTRPSRRPSPSDPPTQGTRP